MGAGVYRRYTTYKADLLIKSGFMKLVCSLLCLLIAFFSLDGQSLSWKGSSVSGIRAAVDGSNIVLSWQKPKNSFGMQYQVYQHTEPITGTNFTEADVVTLLEPEIQQFSMPLDYDAVLWFAVLTVKGGRVVTSVLPGHNSTLGGIAASTYSRNGQAGGAYAGRRSESFVLSGTSSAEILPEDLAPPVGEAHSMLIDVVRQYLRGKRWAEAKEQLFILKAKGQFDSWQESRIVFYLAQCDYYLGNFETAYLSFLVSSTLYPEESGLWIERISAMPGDSGGRKILPSPQYPGSN